jgi:hypothetical protein
MLPTLNESPRYSLTVPSTGKKVRYRPYLVKEEKVLLMASETKDANQIQDAIIDTIRACTDNKLAVRDLTSFDIEYLFIKLRAKSVGESITLYLPCSKEECKQRNEVVMNLDDVECPVDPKKNKVVKLSDTISVEMKYPGYDIVAPASSKEEHAFHIIGNCIRYVITEDEKIDVKDEPEDEVRRFLESMTREQFDKVTSFIRDIPQVEYTIEFDCSSCGEHNEVEVKGMQNFF